MAASPAENIIITKLTQPSPHQIQSTNNLESIFRYTQILKKPLLQYSPPYHHKYGIIIDDERRIITIEVELSFVAFLIYADRNI
jgi:hypothetical protein